MNLKLRKIHYFFEKVFYFFHSHHWITITFCIAVFAIAFIGSLNLKQAVTITDQMDPESQSTKDIIHINQTFSQNSSLGMIILKNDSSKFTNKEICKLQVDVNNLLYSNNFIDDFYSPFKLRIANYNSNILTYDRVLENSCELPQNQNYDLTPINLTPWQNILSGNNHKDIVYNFTFTEIAEPTQYGHFDPIRVKTFMEKISKQIKHKIFWTGPEVMQLFTIEGLNQSQWLNILVIVIIWISLKLFFGTWRAGAIYLGTLIFSTTIVFGGMGLFNHPIDMLSSCLFLLLAISSLQDFIFVAQHQLQTNDNYIKSHLELITPSFFTSFTTILGFSSLMTSELQSIQRFGFWAALGAFIEWVAVFWLIPAFMKIFPSWQKWVSPKKSLSLLKVNRYTILSPPKIVSQLMLIFFIGALFSLKHFRLSQTPSEMFPKNHPYQKMIDYVRETRGWEAEASLVFKDEVETRFKNRIIHQLKSDPFIDRIENFDSVLNYVSSNVDDPLTKDLIISDLKNSKFSDRYINEQNEERSIIYLKTTNTQKINLLKDKINILCPKRECYITGEIIGFADFSKSLINTLFTSLFISLLLVSLTIYFLVYFSKSKNFIKMIISSFWGPAVLLCLIYLFDISINFVTCIIASTLVGLTGDNAIQFLFASPTDNLEQGIQTRAASSFYCSLTMALCSLVFLGSYFDAPKTLGLMLAAGFILSYIGDVWLLRGLNKS